MGWLGFDFQGNLPKPLPHGDHTTLGLCVPIRRERMSLIGDNFQARVSLRVPELATEENRRATRLRRLDA